MKNIKFVIFILISILLGGCYDPIDLATMGYKKLNRLILIKN